MAFDAGTVKGTLDLDARKFLGALSKVEKRLDGVERELKQTRGEAKSFTKGLAVLAAGVISAVVAFKVFGAAFCSLTSLIKGSLEAAGAYEVVIRKLSVALQLAGNTGVGPMVEDLREWATEIQKSTGLSDNLVLSIAGQLTIFGVAQEDLEKFTLAVLDYAAATGQDALTGARLFGKSLSGVLGELSEAIPALKGTTAEALAQGEAFKFAGRAFKDFAKEVGNTSEGIKTKLAATFGDFQKQLGQTVAPTVDAIRLKIIEVFEDITKVVEKNREEVQTFFSTLAVGVVDLFSGLALAILSARDASVGFFTALHVQIPQLASAWAELVVLANKFEVGLQRVRTALFARGAADRLEDARKSLAEAELSADRLTGALSDIVNENRKWKEEAEETSRVLREGIAKAIEKIKAGIATSVDLFKKAGDSAVGVSTSVDKASASMLELVQKSLDGRRAIALAAREADALEDSLEGAARASRGIGAGLGRSAGGGGAVGGTGFGGGTGVSNPSEGRQGGKLGLSLGSFSESLGTLREQERLLAQTNFNGGFQFVTRAQRGVVEQVRNIANAQLDIAFREFTESVVRELNSSGILNPDERSRILQQRIAEAQRLGILPPQRTAGGTGISTGVIGRF